MKCHYEESGCSLDDEAICNHAFHIQGGKVNGNGSDCFALPSETARNDIYHRLSLRVHHGVAVRRSNLTRIEIFDKRYYVYITANKGNRVPKGMNAEWKIMGYEIASPSSRNDRVEIPLNLPRIRACPDLVKRGNKEIPPRENPIV